jgi:hypothetical protein
LALEPALKSIAAGAELRSAPKTLVVFDANVIADLHCEDVGGDSFGAVRATVER